MKIFISYSHIDECHRNNLVTHLAPLKREGVIEVWHDRKTTAGQEWADQIDENLEQASLILLLISSDFLASDYCYDRETDRALEKHQNGEARVIPIIIRSADWSTAPFAKLQALPQDGKPIASWKNKDEAWTDVAKGIRKVVQELSSNANPSVIQRLGEHHQPFWNIPHERNPFFTGREDILEEIWKALVSTGRTAFTGLGGIGKTQTAVEYAYRHEDEYSHIFWINAESNETLISGYGQLASLLNLKKNYAQDQERIFKDIKKWLQQHEQWLLILDNADDLTLIQDLIRGLQSTHILLTTKSEATGTIPRVKVRKLPDEEGAVFLMLRAKIIHSEIHFQKIPKELQAHGHAIVKELDGLPLALDQAGAYIEETQCGLANYLDLYRTHGVDLLRERGIFASGHPDPVATTWVLSFQKIEHSNPAAAELLRFCSFLHPDDIPEELLTEGASELGPILGPVAENPILFNRAIGEILKFSFIQRDMISKTLDIHRLVQAVILKSLDRETRNQWSERLVRAMNHVFQEVEFKNWPQCDRLLPQAKHGALLILTNNLQLQEGARLLNKTACYLHERARYAEAEPLYLRALRINEQALGADHLDFGQSLNNLAGLYYNQGKYAEAEPRYQRVITIFETALGTDHPKVATALNNLALLYQAQGKYAEAEPRYLRALRINEQALGADHLDVGQSLNNLAGLYYNQGKYVEAEPRYQRAQRINEQALGPDHPQVALNLNNLAELYRTQGKYAEAEPRYQRALRINEEALGADHPQVALNLNNLAELYRTQGKYAEAEPRYQRVITIFETVLGTDHPNMATALNNLALLYQAQGKYAEAERRYQRALRIREAAFGPTHPDVGESLNNLAWLYRNQGKYDEAKPRYQSALTILEEALGLEHPNTQTVRENYKDLLKKIEDEKD